LMADSEGMQERWRNAADDRHECNRMHVFRSLQSQLLVTLIFCNDDALEHLEQGPLQ
jgi:hypothetical protein